MSEVRVAELRLIKPPPAQGTVRFYKKGGTYYAIGNDARVIAQKHLRSIGALKGTPDDPFVTMSDVLYVSLLRDLLLYSRTSIELFEFESNKWTKTVEASPGNVAQVIDLISSDVDLANSSVLLAVAGSEGTDQYSLNAACCDSTLFTIATTEFVDSSSLCHFETLLTQTMPSEIIFAGIADSLVDQMAVIVQKFQIPHRRVAAKANVDIGQFPNTKSVKALLSILQLNLSEFKHVKFQLHEFMTVDYSASNALNIFPEPGAAKRAGLPTSLYQLLNECVTPMGSRLLHQYMQQPLLDQEQIQTRLNIVEALQMNPSVMMNVRDAMKQLPDIARIVRKFMTGKATLMDCVRMHDVAAVAPTLSCLTESACEGLIEIAGKIEEAASEVDKVRQLVQRTIDFSMLPQHIYRISPSFDEDLTELADRMEKVRKDMERLRINAASDVGVDDDKMKLERASNQKSFYFRLSRSLERNIRNNDEYNVIETRKDGVHFTTRKLKKLIEEFFDLENEYSQKQREISTKLISTIADFAPLFQSLNDIFAQIDVFCAFATVANASNYVKPVLSHESSEINLVQARHPLVEKHCSFIANDVEMKRGESSFIIISGPNSAGKSTLLKTVGICVYLAHIGCFVPCDAATIPITCSIHARVGAWDCFHMSTFTVEMTEMASILESAKPSSLVLVDELGRSTSCSDGFGLAWAISKRLATGIGCFCLFATHFHELCNLESKIPCVANFHMDARAEENLLMLYQLKPGPFPKSFGIDAAERAGFPPSVMKRAMEKAVELEIADNEEGDTPSHIRIDPNEPYRHLFEHLRALDLENTAPAQLVKITQTAVNDFDEEMSKKSLV